MRKSALIASIQLNGLVPTQLIAHGRDWTRDQNYGPLHCDKWVLFTGEDHLVNHDQLHEQWRNLPTAIKKASEHEAINCMEVIGPLLFAVTDGSEEAMQEAIGESAAG